MPVTGRTKLTKETFHEFRVVTVITKVIIGAGFLVALLTCGLPEDERQIVASVGEENLTLDEILEDLSPQLRSRLTPLDIKEYVLRWIDSEALYQEALGRKLNESEEIKRTLERIRRELIINHLIEESLNKQVAVTDGDVQSYYDSNQDEFIAEDEFVHAYHILVETREDANEVRRLLKEGVPFDEITTQADVDTLGWKAQDRGYVTREESFPEISKAIFNMPIGSYTLPIKTEVGYHIVKVLDKVKKGEPYRYEQVKENIRLKLEAQKRQESYQRFLLQTKSKFAVTTNFQLLNSIVMDSLTQGDETF